jgi:O-antigen/teichoic acid export membrane protein
MPRLFFDECAEIDMSVKTNTIANYIGQIYMLVIGMAVTPLYLQYLGSAAFGLVGFFTLMQAWMFNSSGNNLYFK